MAFAIFICDQSSTLTCHVTGKTAVTIGRAPDNDIVLFDASVSKRHCQVSVSGGVLIMVDLNSSNGVLVNGTKIEAATVINGGDEIKIRSFTMMMRPLTSEEAQRYEAGVDPKCVVPQSLERLAAQNDLSERLGGGKAQGEEGVKAPVSLDSIYRAFNQGEEAKKAPLVKVGDSEQSLESVYHAVVAEEPTVHDRLGAKEPMHSSLNSIFEAVTPAPIAPASDAPNEPKSLNSIFNAVNPIPEALLNTSPASGLDTPLAEEPIVGRRDTNSLESELGALSSAAPTQGSSSDPKSLNSIFNAVNPISDEVLKASSQGAAKSGKKEPKSLNSVFNAVNPIPDELLGKSLQGELGEAHEELEKSKKKEASKPEPKSLNSIFNAVNPLTEFLENQKDKKG